MNMHFPFRQRPRDLDDDARRKLKRSPGVWQPLIRMGIMLLALFVILVAVAVCSQLSSDGEQGGAERSAVPGVSTRV